MGRWLEKIEKSQGSHPPQTLESPLGGLGGEVDTPFPESKVEHSTATDWLCWIEQRCTLIAEDRSHITTTMLLLRPSFQQRLAYRYVESWAEGVADEPEVQRQENAGRMAANASLLVPRASTLVKATHHPHRQQNVTPEPLPTGVCMSWTLQVDGKRLAIAGRPMTQEEALASARARWPGADVEVLADVDR